MSEVIGIVSGKGGTGKTTCACFIGCALAAAGKKVVLADLNRGGGDLSLLFGMEGRIQYDLSHVYEGLCRPEQALLRDHRNSRIALLPAGNDSRGSCTDAAFPERLCASLGKNFDAVILDCPTGEAEVTRAAVLRADQLVMVTDPSLLSVRGCARFRAFLERAGIDPGLLLVNRAAQRAAESRGQLSAPAIASLLKMPLLGVIPEDREIVCAQYRGIPELVGPDTPAGAAFREAGRRLLQREDTGSGSGKRISSAPLLRKKDLFAVSMGENRLKCLTALLKI